jgi:hypothetical protein
MLLGPSGNTSWFGVLLKTARELPRTVISRAVWSQVGCQVSEVPLIVVAIAVTRSSMVDIEARSRTWLMRHWVACAFAAVASKEAGSTGVYVATGMAPSGVLRLAHGELKSSKTLAMLSVPAHPTRFRAPSVLAVMAATTLLGDRQVLECTYDRSRLQSHGRMEKRIPVSRVGSALSRVILNERNQMFATTIFCQLSTTANISKIISSG